MSTKKTLLFSPAAYNLAETTRCIEIAKACKNDFKILFISYGGEFEYLIEKEEFRLERLSPRLTPKQIDHIYKVDQGQKLSKMFNEVEIKKQVETELALLKKIKPAALVTGFVFSNNISCRVAGVPLIWLTHSTWMIESCYKSGLLTYADQLDTPLFRWLGEKILTKLTIALYNIWGSILLPPFNKVAKSYGIKPFKNLEEFWTGDYNLLAEPDSFGELEIPANFHFITPLIARLDTPIPQEVLEIPRNKPLVYFAMGSSGQGKVIKDIIEGFKDCPFNVVSPVKSKLKGLNVKVPPNVTITDWLPAHKVNPMADISVIHGGIGTTMTAAMAGKPVVGVGMMAEQEANIDCLVRKGFAIRIRKNRLSPQILNSAISRLLNDEEAIRKAREYGKSIEKWFNPALITNFFRKYFA